MLPIAIALSTHLVIGQKPQGYTNFVLKWQVVLIQNIAPVTAGEISEDRSHEAIL